MRRFVEPILDGIDTFLAWFSTELGQTVESFCDLETADNPLHWLTRWFTHFDHSGAWRH